MLREPRPRRQLSFALQSSAAGDVSWLHGRLEPSKFQNVHSRKPTKPSLGELRGLTATHTLNRIQLGRRRSSRIALISSVGLSGQDRQKCSFTMPAKAINLNKHGAAVQLHRELSIGSVVAVKNKSGTQISARVVSQLASRDGIPTYAIEFVGQDEKTRDFWGITFPPVD